MFDWFFGNMPYKEEKLKATCVSCGRTFECNEAYVLRVQEGTFESLCPRCDYSDMDDPNDIIEPYDYPPEQEDMDEDKRSMGR